MKKLTAYSSHVITLLLACFISFSALSEPKQRVVSLSPANTELAYAAGLGDNLIAVSAYSDYPEQAKKLEQVSDWQGVNVERIIALKPDLILAWRGGNPQRPLDQLASFGIPIIYFDPQTIDGVIDAVNELSQYSPKPELAQQNISAMRAKLTPYRNQKKSDLKTKKIFIQLGTQPLFSTGKHTLQNDVVTFCGGENIFANSAVQWPQISREQVLTRNPDVIVMTGSIEQEKVVRNFWQSQLDVPIIRLNEDWFHRAGPRIIDATEQLCEQLNALSD
ncbi:MULTISPECIES: vitamin B12 ABC transporter substrate-binding protein BtuF [Providencia]|uniref:vitamin B12 ABC transporter substrate-binding protein BtuF n=1 Tax=Providencia TaxID=586 RepID=UPI001981D779|nr:MULTISPECIES: vitamin B12 ABC transporter substrate-binding protein BtuF [Providencia]MBN4864214.1 vitamin B12 ABC transporter substrate-binding protein BtuF [Providencia stuartii]MBN4873536.1 vitamin B12 ABC transporter substrate-binding protein BtuF [Providencia stuartii]MBN4877343.1 vitamin B12 ABC transporter substrate-binding protein BtuF [Providencia stuartii]MBN4882737.1 vitamin B12 ABC transporter substrate-binding protein BtuF [Providencia stuartii]HEM8292023.1 vitamin B12 ABC tran